jgi:hypothetical protein
MTPERSNREIPEWARQERQHDLAWIGENLNRLWPIAYAAFKLLGRGAIAVDITAQQPGGGHPFGYIRQAVIDSGNDEDMQRMVQAYDPTQELVTILLKADNRTSTYRVGMRRRSA